MLIYTYSISQYESDHENFSFPDDVKKVIEETKAELQGLNNAGFIIFPGTVYDRNGKLIKSNGEVTIQAVSRSGESEQLLGFNRLLLSIATSALTIEKS